MVDAHRRPQPPYEAGPEAAKAGATAMIDVSDGLVADLGHVATASGVRIDLDSTAFAVPDALSQVASALSVDPLTWVLRGGEDHALVATFGPDQSCPRDGRSSVPCSTRLARARVTVDAKPYAAGGFDHSHLPASDSDISSVTEAYTGRVNDAIAREDRDTTMADDLLDAVGLLRRRTRRVVGRPWPVETLSMRRLSCFDWSAGGRASRSPKPPPTWGWPPIPSRPSFASSPTPVCCAGSRMPMTGGSRGCS